MPEEFVDRDLRGARFVRCLLSLDIESPWLVEAGSVLLVNGVDVVRYVDTELDRRFPGRELRRADTPAGLRAAWSALEATWAATTARAETLPPGSVDVSVDGEWSFAQTLRHLVMATDVWLRMAVLGVAEPYHPLGQPHAEYETDGYDLSVFATGVPAYADVLAVRAERQAMVRDVLAEVSEEQLSEPRPHPWGPDHQVTVLHCLHTILEEEWEHHRYAGRDLQALANPRA